MTVYSDHPLEIAEDFQKAGATCLHTVDLEGAKSGETPNLEVIRHIVRNTDLFTEVGGGIRSMQVIERYLDAGIGRVILGTAAVTDRPFLERAAADYKEKIAVGVDIKDGYVAIRGWTEKSELNAFDFCKDLQQLGIHTIICTDISRDGAMKGTNVELYDKLREMLDMQIIASGGVTDMNDIIRLRSMDLYGAIIGKAYYTGAIDLKEAIAAAR